MKKLAIALLTVVGLVAGNVFARCGTCCPRRTCERPAKPCVRMVEERTCAKDQCETTCHKVCPVGYTWAGDDMGMGMTKSNGKRSY
jgi:hypothetical protein